RSQAATSSLLVRSPPKSAPIASRSRIRARACAMPTSMCAARKARRNDNETVQAPQVAHALQHFAEGRWPSTSVDLPFGQAYLCPGDRRRGRNDARDCLDERKSEEAA